MSIFKGEHDIEKVLNFLNAIINFNKASRTKKFVALKKPVKLFNI